MRYDPIARVRRFLGAVLRRRATIDPEPLPAPPSPQEHHANVEFMAECLFGLPMNELGLIVTDTGPKTMFRADGSRKERADDS